MKRKYFLLSLLLLLLPMIANAYDANLDALSYNISDNYNSAVAAHINNNVGSFVKTNTDTINVYRIPMITSANQLSSPYSDYAEGTHIEYLIDGDKSTFWHTDWHGQSPEGMYYNGIECHYLQITGMENMIGNCEMYFCQRSISTDNPSKLVLMGTDNLSDDGVNEEWSEIAVLEIPYTGSGEENLIPFTVEKAYPYVRVLVFDCAGNYGFRTYWHAAEIQFYTSSLGGDYSISVSLPEDINVQDYAKMWLELTNTESGQRIHYVLTERMQYTFANIPANTSWNITLRNERGDVFGQIDNIEVKDKDVSVTFNSLSKPQSVALSVLTPEGQDVTSQTQINWTDASGNYLAQGASLSGLPVGCYITYSVVLSQNLAMRYFTPQPVDYIIKDGDNNITCLLISQSEEYDAALASVINGSYYIMTEVDGNKYYVSRQGELRDVSVLVDNAEDGLFKISQVSGGALYDVGWLLEGNTGSHFSNTTLINSKANLHPGTGVFRVDDYYNRNDWERQVFFMNKEGKFAIRSCNTAYGTSSWADAGRAFWTYEVDEYGNPVYIDDYTRLMPCYSYEPAYVWMLEQSSMMIKVLIDGINYIIDNDRMLAEVTSLSDNVKYSGNVVIPPSISYNGKTYSVTRIGSRAFEGCSSLTSVSIPKSVTSIGGYAFMNCMDLTAVTFAIGSELKSIGTKSFNNCQKLTSVNLGDKLISMGDYAFQDCQLLESITIPGTLKIIPFEAFENCFALASVTLCEGIEVISDGAFYDTDALTEITIPASVKKIGRAPFYCNGNHAMKRMIIDDSDIPLEFANNATDEYPWGLGHLTDDITLDYFYMGRDINRFNTNYSLVYNIRNLEIGPKVTTIGGYAFYGCNQLTDVYCLAENVPETSNYAFSNSPIASATLHVPEKSVDLYKAVSPWNGFGSIVPLTSPIDEVVDEADWTLLKLAYIEMGSGEGWNRKWIFDDESHLLSGLGGVSISNGRVTSINLSSNNLTGTFPYELLLLPNLKVLNFSHNNLTGNIDEISEKLKKEDQTSPITTLNISDNKLSGNIGLFANCFANLKSLNASGNCLENVDPMISPNVTSLNLSSQTIDRVVDLHLGMASSGDYIIRTLPRVLLYDHATQTFTPNINMRLTTLDDSWGMTLIHQNGQLSSEKVSTQNIYYDEKENILNVAVLNNDGTREGSTFRISLNFDEGDSNFDGKVNVLDLQAILNYIFEEYNNDKPYNFTASNLWKDEIINVQDAVRLVNLLLDADMASANMASNTRRVAAFQSESEASVFIEDGQLIINTTVPVSAFDIVISTEKKCEVLPELGEMGYTCTIKRNGNQVHLIGYSLSGASLPIGNNTICSISEGTLDYVMMADKEAQEIKCYVGSSVTNIQDTKSNVQSKEVYRIPVGVQQTIIIDSVGKKSLIKNE